MVLKPGFAKIPDFSQNLDWDYLKSGILATYCLYRIVISLNPGPDRRDFK